MFQTLNFSIQFLCFPVGSCSSFPFAFIRSNSTLVLTMEHFGNRNTENTSMALNEFFKLHIAFRWQGCLDLGDTEGSTFRNILN